MAPDQTTAAYRCYAKINLTLEVLRRRDDGYHDLASLVHTISLADDLRIGPAAELTTHVDGLDIPAETNLVNRAAHLLAAAASIPPAAELTLVKRIPAAAGLGGGSSDAAATLVGLDTLWRTRLSSARLAALAGQLGADVPFFMRGGAAVMSGRGDELQALPPLERQWFVVVVLAHAVADKTRRMYAALEPRDFSNGEATRQAAERLLRRQPFESADLVNAFARAARLEFAELREAWTQVERVSERRFYLSGAGPALFGLASGREDAQHQRARLGGLGWPTHAARSVRQARARIDLATGPTISYP